MLLPTGARRVMVFALAAAALALAGCGSGGGDVQTVQPAAQSAGPPSAAAQAPVQGPAATAGGKHPPGPSQACPPQLAYWTDDGATTAVHVNVPAGANVAVSVEPGQAVQEAAGSRRAAAAHDFSFAVPGSQVTGVSVRVNEAGCVAQKRTTP